MFSLEKILLIYLKSILPQIDNIDKVIFQKLKRTTQQYHSLEMIRKCLRHCLFDFWLFGFFKLFFVVWEEITSFKLNHKFQKFQEPNLSIKFITGATLCMFSCSLLFELGWEEYAHKSQHQLTFVSQLVQLLLYSGHRQYLV